MSPILIVCLVVCKYNLSMWLRDQCESGVGRVLNEGLFAFCLHHKGSCISLIHKESWPSSICPCSSLAGPCLNEVSWKKKTALIMDIPFTAKTIVWFSRTGAVWRSQAAVSEVRRSGGSCFTLGSSLPALSTQRRLSASLAGLDIIFFRLVALDTLHN